MPTITYKGTAFRQAQDPQAPWLVSFVAPAEEVLQWAGIPRKSDSALMGFQRPDEEPRVFRARDYFAAYSMNQSPTSLVMGVHPATNGAKPISITFDQGSQAPIRPCTLRVDFDPNESLSQAITRLRAQIQSRLQEEGADADAGEEELTDESEVQAVTESQEAETDDSGEEQEIELGRSLLQDLLAKLDDQSWCAAHEQDIRDLSKPATIIDGQHRILGAKLCERRIPFSIIAIMDCSWPEQVFQFTVVNYTAKGIPDQFITANAALSLTAGELADLEGRLQQAGVKVIEYELMRVINFDPESPFKDLINLTEKKADDRIGYKTMVQVGKTWYLGKDNAVRQIIDHLYPDLVGKSRANARARLQRWKEEHWGVFFKDFWSVVHDAYVNEKTEDGDSLWSVGSSNLMIAAVLHALQEQFLTNLAAQDETFFQIDDPGRALEEMRAKIRKRATTFFSYFKPDLFAKAWKLKSLNTGAGRTHLRGLFREVADSRGAYQYGKHPIFTGNPNG